MRDVKNHRLTHIAAAMMAAAMDDGRWGETDDNGTHRKYNLQELERMVCSSARRVVAKLDVF